jgi:VanZ family protein
VIVLIIYGSLYPWHFVPTLLAANPFRILIQSWPGQPFTFFIRDVVLNIVLYIPLGFAASLALRKTGPPGFAIYGPVLLAAGLSVAIELTQLFVPSRNTSMIDVLNNVLGSCLGVVVGLLYNISGHRGRRRPGEALSDHGAVFLAICWAIWLVFPGIPLIGFYEPRRKFGLLLHANWFDPLPLVTEAAGFFAAAWLITRAGIRLPRPWLFAMLLIIPAQIFIAGRQPKPAEMIGAAAGLALFAALERPSGPVRTEAWVFLLVLILSGLAPFKFSSEAKGFDWIPFDTTLTGEWQSAAVTLTKKIFYYGAAVWLLKASGMRLWRSVSIVAAVLAVIEVIQTRLPGRFAEITDPLLAIMIGFVLSKI